MSSESSRMTPSSHGQRIFAEALAAELRALGVPRVELSAEGVLYATLPASPDCATRPAIGFIAHLDTAPAAPGANVNPLVHENYDGGDISLSGGITISPQQFPVLSSLRGKTLITADGTTLLGADDKAGVAILMTLAESLLASSASHPAVQIAFTPDEEIGEGTRFFDIARFGASVAYTVDGGASNEYEYACFNGASATFTFHGISVHPGSAKGIMRNALRLASEALRALPPHETPEETDGRQGFYHPVSMEGSVSRASLTLLIRDHSSHQFEVRKEELRHIAKDLNAAYGEGSVELSLSDQYHNMEETILRNAPQLLQGAHDAIASLGLTPCASPIRGGTDGAALTERGLPCPNLGTGGYNFHGLHEFAVLEQMHEVLEICRILCCKK